VTFVVDGTVAALVAVLIQTLFKPLLELWLKSDAPNHDTVVRALALLLGVVLLAVDTLIGGPWPATGNSWLLLIGSGALSGASAVGIYHLLTGSATPANAVTVIPATALPAPVDTAPPVPPAVPAPAPTQHVVTLQLANAPTPTAPEHIILPAGTAPEPAATAATPA
jgi:hypothetical protein